MSYSHVSNEDNNNNNSIPSFYEGVVPQLSQVMDNLGHVRSFGMGGLTHSFTFASPTQGTTAPTPRQAIQTTSSMPFGWAPGMGTAWQHSHPTTMSVANGGSIGGISSVFTGMPNRSEPQPSCSSPMKRPKRKAKEFSEYAPSSKVYICTDKLANLNLNTDTPYQSTTPRAKGHDPMGWNHFHEVERNIGDEFEEDGEATEDEEEEQKGVLRLDESVAESLTSKTSSSILPKDIVKEISKPCMQVVLWKSPGQLVRDFVREDVSSLNQNSQSQPSSPPSPPKNVHIFHSSSVPKQTFQAFQQHSSLQSPSVTNHTNFGSQSPFSLKMNGSGYTLNQDSSMWDDNLDLDLNDEDMQL